MRYFKPSIQTSAKNLPGHTKLKFRQVGQSSIEELAHKDLRAELEEKERQHFAKGSRGGLQAFEGERWGRALAAARRGELGALACSVCGVLARPWGGKPPSLCVLRRRPSAAAVLPCCGVNVKRRQPAHIHIRRVRVLRPCALCPNVPAWAVVYGPSQMSARETSSSWSRRRKGKQDSLCPKQ